MSLIAAVAPAVSASLAGRRVLVIEDEYFIADDMARALASLDAEVIGPIGEIKEAQQLLDAGTRIDGAVLDINIRSEMIFPLARTLRSRNVPFLFTTGYDRGSLGPEFDDVAVWEKPIDIPALVRSLADMMLNRAR